VISLSTFLLIVCVFSRPFLPFLVFLFDLFVVVAAAAGERVGCLHLVCSTPEQSTAVLSQLEKIARVLYSVCRINSSLLFFPYLFSSRFFFRLFLEELARTLYSVCEQ
jgi:hypothetical protein